MTNEDAKDILMVYDRLRKEEFTVRFVRGFGVTWDGFMTRTGSAKSVAEGLWEIRNDTDRYQFTYLAVLTDLKKYEYLRDVYDLLNVGFQRWHRG